MVIIVMGPQGSGKTTQAEKISKAFGIPHLESGEIFREIATQDSDLGRRVKEALASGQLVNKTDADAVIQEMLTKAKYQDHVVIDGFPRDLDQAQRYREHIDRVFYLDVEEDECIARLMERGRADDTPDVIRERLRLYRERTVPVLEYFDSHAILETIDGNRHPDSIFEDIHKRITRMLQVGELELLT
jgi:adenylate kinase